MTWTVLAGLGMLAATAFAAVMLTRLFWRVHGQWRIRRAGPRRLAATRLRIWHEPRDVASLLRYGPGGADGVPAAPFRFVDEQMAGSQPCVRVRDARDRLWRVKWGHEARPESFAVRLAAACGFFAEVTHFVASGHIDGVEGLSRASGCIAGDGSFQDARFEREDRDVRMLFNEHSWSWDDNPFLGTPQLDGLKIVAMLVSNWDTKDRRDVSRGSNTAIFEHRLSRWSWEARYLISDWGGALGRWGTNVVSRGRWDVAGFEAQTPQFVTGVRDGLVTFGYQGQRTAEIAAPIPLHHVEWFWRLASRLDHASLRSGLDVCGATAEESERFAAAIDARIRQLGDACRRTMNLDER
jgi:hypothetical protein